jgi:hypothetical protein
MNHNDVQLIGVFDPDGKDEGFVYSVNAPVNLWMEALCTDGSRMGHEFMACFLNLFIDDDKFSPGDAVEIRNQAGVLLRAVAWDPVPKEDLQAYQALTPTVLPVTVEVFDDE